MKENVNIKLPTAWTELSDIQLRYVFSLLLANLSFTQVKIHCLLKWGDLKFVRKEGALFLFRQKGRNYLLSASAVNGALAHLAFIDAIPGYPVRLSHIGWHKPFRADFQDVPFGDFLTLDNLYQGYLQQKNSSFLVQMAQIMYNAPKIKLDAVEELSIFYWFASVKQYLSQMYPHFLKVRKNNDDEELSQPSFRQLMEAMNTQIRALTGGDITKEEAVLKMDCWRALTELDAKAKDYEEISRKKK
ncbi:MAG: hypothetical protein KBT34_04930 [Prevotella sp.]|nr:hypothetical protein [Candidatus Prevotella equi]